MGTPKDLFQSAKNKVVSTYTSLSDVVREKYKGQQKEEETKKTPLEQMTDDWMSIYGTLKAAQKQNMWGERIELLQQSQSQLEELTRKYPLSLPEEEGYAKEYEELWRYTRQLTTKVSTALNRGGDIQDIQTITQEVEQDIVRPYEELQRATPTKESLFETLKSRLGKDGKKMAIGSIAAITLYALKRRF